jgi:hypothetical protein
MRGITVQLPEAATNKLTELTSMRDSALDAMRSTQQRINTVPLSNHRLIEKLGTERDKQSARHNVLARIVNSLNQYLVELRLPMGRTLEITPEPDIRLKPSDSLPDLINGVRAEIAVLNVRIAQVRAAPMKRSAQEEAIRGLLEEMSVRAAPRVAFDRNGSARLSWSDDGGLSRTDVLALLCFILPEAQLMKALTLELPPEQSGALSPLEREQQIVKLANDLLLLERKEKYLIERAAADGTEVLRRPEASPMASLGIVISPGQAQQQRVA